MSRILSSLGQPLYRTFTVGSAISLVGSWTQRVAVAWLVWEMTASTTWLGLVAFAELFPMIVLAPFAGALADRLDRLRVMRINQVLLLIVSLCVTGLAVNGSLTPTILLVAAAIGGSIVAFDHPFRLSMLPSLVDRTHLASAVALNSVIFNSARFIGPVVAGVLIAIGHPWIAFAANAACVGVFLWTLLLLPRLTTIVDIGEPEGILAAIRGGFAYSVRDPVIVAMYAVLAITSLAARPVAEILPSLAARFDTGSTYFATMSALFGAGAVIGGTMVGNVTGSRRLVALTAYSGYTLGVLLVAAGLVENAAAALLVVAAIGAGMAVNGVACLAVIQTMATPAYRGRVLSLHTIIFRGGPAVGALLLGFLADWAGVGSALVLVGCLALLAAACVSRLQRTARQTIEAMQGGSRDDDG